MPEMTWEQKFEAMNALDESELRMRKPGDWFCVIRGAEMQKPGGCGLEGRCGNGNSPQAAVENAWFAYTKPIDNAYIVLDAMSPEKRRHVRWNGYRWADIPR